MFNFHTVYIYIYKPIVSCNYKIFNKVTKVFYFPVRSASCRRRLNKLTSVWVVRCVPFRVLLYTPRLPSWQHCLFFILLELLASGSHTVEPFFRSAQNRKAFYFEQCRCLQCLNGLRVTTHPPCTFGRKLTWTVKNNQPCVSSFLSGY